MVWRGGDGSGQTRHLNVNCDLCLAYRDLIHVQLETLFPLFTTMVVCSFLCLYMGKSYFFFQNPELLIFQPTNLLYAH